MPRYMLDTDTCSYIMKRSNDAVLKRLQEVRVSDVCISVSQNRSYSLVLNCPPADTKIS